MTLPLVGARKLTTETAARTEAPTTLRTGTIVTVTARGVVVSVAEGLVPAAHLDSYAPAVGDPVLVANFQDSWTVLGRPVGTGTGTDLATPGSAAGTTLLGGSVLSGTGATLASSTGSAVVVPRYRCTFYHPPGHQVLVLGGVSWYSSVLNDTMTVALNDAQGGAQVNSIELTQTGTVSFGHFETFGAMLAPDPAGGRKRDLYMVAQRVGGSGASRVDDPAGRRGFLAALDMGDGSVIATV